MPKFTVRFRQWAEEVAELEVEADTAEAALELAHQKERDGELMDWSDGNECRDVETWSVEDDNGKELLGLNEIMELNGEFG